MVTMSLVSIKNFATLFYDRQIWTCDIKGIRLNVFFLLNWVLTSWINIIMEASVIMVRGKELAWKWGASVKWFGGRNCIVWRIGFPLRGIKLIRYTNLNEIVTPLHLQHALFLFHNLDTGCVRTKQKIERPKKAICSWTNVPHCRKKIFQVLDAFFAQCIELNR